MTVTLPVPATFLADTLVAVTRAWFDQGFEEPVAESVDGALVLRAGPRREPPP